MSSEHDSVKMLISNVDIECTKHSNDTNCFTHNKQLN